MALVLTSFIMAATVLMTRTLSSLITTSKFQKNGRRGGVVSVLDSGENGPGSGPGREHCVVFLGKTLYSHGASLYPGV